MSDDIKYRIEEYEFADIYEPVPAVEAILKEYNIETHVVWVREDDFTGARLVSQYEPIAPELYNICYTCMLEQDNARHLFADYLIESTILNICKLEGCLEINNKKEDTE